MFEIIPIVPGCKSRNGESRNEMRGIRVGMRGIMVGIHGMRGMMRMWGIRVVMRGNKGWECREG